MDTKEFREKVLPISRKIFRYALRLLRDNHDAEDVVQDIWMKLWDKKDQVAELKSIEAYAFRMTRNLCLDKIKLKKPQYYDDREDATYRFDRPAEMPDPLRIVELKDTMDKVNQIIGKLPEQQQTLLQLRDIEGMQYDEISAITGLGVNTIRVNLSRARKNLRETLHKINEA
jgi:RNA polymerase sigma-70 factor (ECF subfamily)